MDYHHPSRQLQQEEQEQQVVLEVVGRHALLFDDDTTLAFINSSEALVPWSGGDPSLLIDRFDVRHLLHRLPPPRATRKVQEQEDDMLEPDGVSRVELDLERYRDLKSGSDEAGEERTENTEVARSSAYNRVQFSYGAQGGLKGDDAGLKSSAYLPPFPVPDHLLGNLPPTEKVHQIISRTAKFVSVHGGQSEIILRVKQGGNPTFGFLMPEHELHAYFRFLVDNPEFAKVVTDSSDKEEGMKASASTGNELPDTGGALSLLGHAYGSVDDDGGTRDNLEAKEPQGKNLENIPAAPPCRSELSSSKVNEKVKATVKTSSIEKPTHVKKSRLIAAISGTTKRKAKETSAGSANLCINRPETKSSDPNTLVVEPPSSIKRMVDKTVEFIFKNGREFEASLIQQDKADEKFPFLRPSSQYHSYYLKALRDTREVMVHSSELRRTFFVSDISKSCVFLIFDAHYNLFLVIVFVHYGSCFLIILQSKDSRLPRNHLPDHKTLSVQHMSATDGRTAYDAPLSDARDIVNQFQGSYQFDRKEKFRMVIGGGKKDASNPSSKPSKPGGLSAEEAAAIVMAATRGISSKTVSHTAPRGSMHDPSTISDDVDGRRSSSLGGSPSFSDNKRSSKTASGGRVGDSSLGCASHDTGKPGKGSCRTDGASLVANAIAQSVASEADSSDAYLTEEQKLKTERLKRAKIFAAMIKNKREMSPALTHGGQEKVSVSTVLPNDDPDLGGKERESSTLPVDAEVCDSGEKYRGRTSISKRGSSPEKDEPGSAEDASGEHKHSKKRHHSRHSSPHASRRHRKHKHHRSHRHKHHDSDDEDSHAVKDNHKRRRRRSSSKHKHEDSEEDGHADKKSKSRHRHEHRRSSDNGSPDKKASRRHHRRSRAEEKNPNLENEADPSTPNLPNKVSWDSSNGVQEVARPVATPEAAPSSVATEVPDDLRAKIRAMLLETM